ncbi:phosphotransferase family protein [Protofrankia symbiont of Coriaria ruscifolia]|uniref:phosphotransferase family protein n=1 Tax=Protofrankia symbiont of Coriaria ruscifolia TaxID=1306542 RepID=UPI001F5EC61B|nr:aminoglycoside phosphotransferase family protein [Protofrankia symbiont of Coriaria ruscifolia]
MNHLDGVGMPADVPVAGGGRFTVTRAWKVLQEICAAVGLDGRDAELIKIAANAVFRLPRAGVIVRISGSQAMAHRADKVVQVARWLACHDVPAVRLAPGLPAPLRIADTVATLWIDAGSGRSVRSGEPSRSVVGIPFPPAGGDEQLRTRARGSAGRGVGGRAATVRGATAGGAPRTDVSPTARDLAVALRQLHALPLPDVPLPRFDPLADVRRRLADAEGLHAADLAFLRRLASRCEAALESVAYALPAGIVHGDAHLGNLVKARDGEVLICDFDAICHGPTEWDLIPLAVGRLRFGYPLEQHVALASAYGFDVMRWPGFEVLRAVRELKLVTSVVPVLASNPRVAAQFAVRLASLRYRDETVRWMPYS